MSRIDELIQQLCPDGVEYKPLGEVAKRNKGISITASKMKEIEVPGGPYRVFAAGQTQVDTTAEHIPVEKLITEPSIIVKARGYIAFEYCVRPFTHKSEIWSYTVTDPRIDQRFVYHYLLAQEDSLRILAKSKSVKLPQLATGDTDRISIPVPPLEVQQEIVRVLDAFIELEDNLQRELDARRKQYEHYRDELLSFGDDVEYAELGSLGTLYGGLSGKTKADFKEGANASFVPYTNVFNNIAIDLSMLTPVEVGPGEKQNAIQEGDVLFTTSSETPDECAMSSVVDKKPEGQIYLNSFCRGFRPNADSEVGTGYLKHLLRSQEMRTALSATANGVTRFNVSKKLLLKVKIPVPSLARQQEISDRLDVMLALQFNLQRQIDLTHRQYEHYRDRLLDLPRKGA